MKETVRKYYKRTTFNSSDTFQTYTVPAGITTLKIDCVASRGHIGSKTAGKGGRVQCDMAVTPNQTFYIMVGAIPSAANKAEYNAADIRTDNTGVTDTTSLNSRLIVAGGGGSGSTANTPGGGGGGGKITGGAGIAVTYGGGGGGGTQSAGGARGSSGMYYTAYGKAGGFGLGGVGAYGATGGAGWYGGGGGSGGAYGSSVCGGGGGGSSYTNSAICKNTIHTQGYRDGTGYITIAYQSTSSDYDYYVDEYTYKAVKDGSRYKLYKTN